MQVTILGNSSGGPFHGRHYTAQFVQVERHGFLVDCGEGTQMQIFRYRVKIDRCNQVFISHLHGDHVFGLIGLITNWCLKKRTEPLQIFSPPGLQELIETTIRVCGVRLTYPLAFQEVDASVSAMVFENKHVEVWTIPLYHRTPTAGWLFREKPKPRNIRPEILEQYAIADDYVQIRAIKAGEDLVLPDGQIIPNTALTLEPSPPCSYAFCSDTAPSPAVAEVVRGVDLLYHEATFTEENLEEARIAFHATARQAAGIARQAGVTRLIIGHFSGRYADAVQHLVEARAVFEPTELAEEGFRWEVGKDEPPFALREMDIADKQMMRLVHKAILPSEKSQKMENPNLVRTSKFLSQILRHKPGKIGLTLDDNGWADVAELLEKAAANGMVIDRETLQTVVDTNDKKRFAFSDDGLRIRASQGHSIEIDLDLKPQTPPEILFHGTAETSLKSIRKGGLLPMRRQHVHLSKDKDTAQKVGGRHGKAVVLSIRSGDMARQKFKFYLSDNGVWLTAEVPEEFIAFP